MLVIKNSVCLAQTLVCATLATLDRGGYVPRARDGLQAS